MNKPQNHTTALQKAQKASKNPNHNQFERLTSLPQEKFDIVVSMIKKGHSPRLIARTMQTDWAESNDVSEKHLARILERYRIKHVPLHDIVDPYVMSSIVTKVKRNINHLEAMSELVELQQERLRHARLEEEWGVELLPKVDKQITLLTRILRNYADISYKAGLTDIFVTEFRRQTDELEQQVVCSMETIHRTFIRNFYLDDPKNFEIRLKNLFAEVAEKEKLMGHEGCGTSAL